MCTPDISPYVSVIIPTYNRADVLPRAIKSVLAQTYQYFELIIVDDGSTDDTASVVADFHDTRISFIRASHSGACAARNTGVANARYDIIAFLDSDNQWVSEKLTIQLQLWQKYMFGEHILFSSFKKYCFNNDSFEILPDSSVSKLPANVPLDIINILLDHNVVDTSTMLLHKSAFVSIGKFDPAMPRMQDWDLAIRLCRKYQFIFIDQPLVCTYYNRSDNISHDSHAAIIAICRLIKKNEDLLFNPSCRLIQFLSHFMHDFLQKDPAMQPEFNDIVLNEFCNRPDFLLIFLKYMTESFFTIDHLYSDITMLNSIISNKYEPLITSCGIAFPFHKISRNSNVIIYGAGINGKHLYDQLAATNYCHVVAWIDQKVTHIANCPIRIMPPDAITSLNFDYIIISPVTPDVITEIREMLFQFNIPGSKIIDLRNNTDL